MTRTITLQPAPHTDHITADGSELTKLPYPYHVAGSGMIQRQDFWDGMPLRVIGFQKDLAVQQVDLWWDEAWSDPTKAVGMYLVTQDKHGDFFTHMSAISEVIVND